jgi:hypothetical protein
VSRQDELVGSASAICETFLGREDRTALAASDRAALAASALIARVHMKLSKGAGASANAQAAGLVTEKDCEEEQHWGSDGGRGDESLALATTAACLPAPPPPTTVFVPLPIFCDVPSCETRRVHFNIGAITEYEVIPYAEIYGEHPRTFVFDRDSCKIAAAPGGFVSLQALQELDRDDEDGVDDLSPWLDEE